MDSLRCSREVNIKMGRAFVTSSQVNAAGEKLFGESEDSMFNLSGSFFSRLTTAKLKFPDSPHGPVVIDLGTLPDIPGIPSDYGRVTTMACGEEGNDCGIDIDPLEATTVTDDYS
jgi:hypothetical protein